MAPSAILSASKALPGGARPTSASQAGQGPYIGRISPLVQQLANERGYAGVYGGFLPRPPRAFTEGAFGPFAPIMPVPVDAPEPGFERPQPRRFSYRTGYNLPVGEPGTEGYKIASFDTLKTISKSYSRSPAGASSSASRKSAAWNGTSPSPATRRRPTRVTGRRCGTSGSAARWR